MISERKIALLYNGTPHRKTTSNYVVELIGASNTEFYFFDDLADANRFILVCNSPPTCPLFYDLSDTFIDDVFNYDDFNAYSIYGLKTRFMCGRGINAKIYPINCNWVIRKSEHNYDGFIAAYHIPDKHRKRLLLPAVDRIQSDPDAGVFFVEKLFKVNPRIFDDAILLSLKINNPLLYLKRSILDDHIAKNHPLYPVFYAALLIQRYLRRNGVRVTIDINRDNIMARANGELVLNDAIGVILNTFSYEMEEIK